MHLVTDTFLFVKFCDNRADMQVEAASQEGCAIRFLSLPTARKHYKCYGQKERNNILEPTDTADFALIQQARRIIFHTNEAYNNCNRDENFSVRYLLRDLSNSTKLSQFKKNAIKKANVWPRPWLFFFFFFEMSLIRSRMQTFLWYLKKNIFLVENLGG